MSLLKIGFQGSRLQCTREGGNTHLSRLQMILALPVASAMLEAY
jgi:hypothetical protein